MVIAIYLKAKIKGTKYIEKNSLCIFVLFTNSLLCHFRCPNKGFMQPNKAFFEIINIVACLGHHGILPGSHAQGVPGQGHGGRAYDGGGEGHKGLAVNHGQFGQVLCQGCSPFTTSGQAGQVIYKKVGGGWGAFKIKDAQDQLFHSQHLTFRVRVVRDVAELRHVGRIDLLVFPVSLKLDM